MVRNSHDWYPPSHTRPTSELGVVEVIVDNRTMLLGLDYMYREVMKRFEAEQLLVCAQEVCARLNLGPADCPVEGYYTESAELRRYFLLMRSLQGQSADMRARVGDLESLRLLEKVTSSSIFGRKGDESYLLPRSLSPLAEALERSQGGWTVRGLVERAHQIARGSDDHSLVGLAARAGDPVVVAALRETVCLYEMLIGRRNPITYRYVWNVDDDLCGAANRFVVTFNDLVSNQYEPLPPVSPEHAGDFAICSHTNDVVGRCVCIGMASGKHYHWAICMRREDEQDPGSLFVDEFWSRELWTTERYRKLQGNKVQMRPFAEHRVDHG